MDPSQEESIGTFMAIAGCDREFATSFLEANGWHLESAVNQFTDPGGGGMAAAGGSALGANPAGGFDPMGFEDEEPRAKIEQYRDTLIDVDPAQQRVPQRAGQAAAAQPHPLEAFRDFRREGEGAGGAGSSADGGEQPREVFGLPKRPKNLAEIYRAPTELCFNGTFDDLREAGKKEGKWLLVNIQSPTEFASQQLNVRRAPAQRHHQRARARTLAALRAHGGAVPSSCHGADVALDPTSPAPPHPSQADTWQDETLRQVITASFLFWQQYYDSPAGSQFCRFYLPGTTKENPAGLPHIAIVDPVTGASVKTWTGFKDSEVRRVRPNSGGRLRARGSLGALSPSLAPCPIVPDRFPTVPDRCLSAAPQCADLFRWWWRLLPRSHRPRSHRPQRLMDKLMEYADEPPCDMLAALSPSMLQEPPSSQLSPLKPEGGGGSSFPQPALGSGMAAGGDDESADLAAAIAASLSGSGGEAAPMDAATSAEEPAAPAGPSEAEVDAMWGAPCDEPSEGGMPLKIRLLDGKNIMRKFLPTHTLRDVLCAIHFSGCRLDPERAYKLSAPMARINAGDMQGTLQSQGVERGAYTLSEG